ncbi:MAG: hypothetical protein KAT62_10160 [Desulfuromonadales bacterium]|nr:hypothetical protein [Desulfuromonadales bacterium]
MALKWAHSLLARFHEPKEAIEFQRLKKGITQELHDELIPLGKYAKSHYNNPEIYLRFYSGSETSYDAEFVDKDERLIERVEVTMAIDGQQARIQSEAINKFGHSPVYQTPNYTGTSKNRSLGETESVTISSDTIIEIQAERLKSAYLKKHKNIHKYPNTTLLIGVDIPLFMEWEYQRIIENFQPLNNTFQSIKCVNISSEHCWHLK